MYSNKIIFVIATTIFVFGTPVSPQNLDFLVTVGEKGFYYDNSTIRSWNAASSFCRAASMELAAFESQPEVELVVGALQNATRNIGWFWTSGKLTSTPDAYYWTTNENQLSTDVIAEWNDRYPNILCVGLYINLSGHVFFNYECTGSGSLDIRGVLCQSKT